MGCCASRTSVVHAAPPPYQAPQPPPPPPTKITPLSKPTFIYVKENLQTNIILSTDEYIDVLVDRNELRLGRRTNILGLCRQSRKPETKSVEIGRNGWEINNLPNKLRNFNPNTTGGMRSKPAAEKMDKEWRERCRFLLFMIYTLTTFTVHVVLKNCHCL